MYEDRTVEEKYLYNFSDQEKKDFIAAQQKRQEELSQYRMRFNRLIAYGTSGIFSNYEPRSTTPLEIRYILNRIAANDPRDQAFELGWVDSILNGDQYALQIARAFQNNTVCHRVVLRDIGLTDKGMAPILSSLKDKDLSLLDIGGNKLTEESFRTIDHIFAHPQNAWQHVRLGMIDLTSERAESFRRNPHISFSYERADGVLRIFSTQPFLR